MSGALSLGRPELRRQIPLHAAHLSSLDHRTHCQVRAARNEIWIEPCRSISVPRTAGIGALQPVADHAAAHAAHYYGQYLGRHGQFERSLDHVARAIELLGARSELFEQAIAMTLGGRCYSARAGRLEEAFAYARRASEAADALDQKPVVGRSARPNRSLAQAAANTACASSFFGGFRTPAFLPATARAGPASETLPDSSRSLLRNRSGGFENAPSAFSRKWAPQGWVHSGVECGRVRVGLVSDELLETGKNQRRKTGSGSLAHGRAASNQYPVFLPVVAPAKAPVGQQCLRQLGPRLDFV